eukprot:CAMPEP_0182453898 /NCGR_PEP_ID=MMETSP1319-20130603/759_1 /TAXON_ID=172717 /ORGANISM="Bolidomonas pacifica, Strain RCC208" /LENGTH=279 /DNA_ID=CAMNT_0024651857 /DNA_START=65 /DNA_END=900 /DNA_ORIENTATION=+
MSSLSDPPPIPTPSNTSDTSDASDSVEDASSRMEYLKSRGVEIETVEDRQALSSSSSSSPASVPEILKQLSCASCESSGGCSFAFVPVDSSRPIRQVHLPGSGGIANADLLPDFVRPYFADGRGVDAGLMRDQAAKHFAAGALQGLDPTNLSASSMDKVAALGSVETFPLVRPAASNGHTGVYVYLDEVGLLKKLAANPRASRLAAACGYDPAPNFYGDVFVGRCQTKPSLRNVDFVVGEDTSLDAEWMKRAVRENVEWQVEMNSLTGRTGELQPLKDG